MTSNEYVCMKSLPCARCTAKEIELALSYSAECECVWVGLFGFISNYISRNQLLVHFLLIVVKSRPISRQSTCRHQAISTSSQSESHYSI